MHQTKLKQIVYAVASLLAMQGQAFAENKAETLETAAIEVVATTPLPGLGIPKDQIPSAIQTVKSEDFVRSQSLDISDYMNRNLGSVYVNEVQNNPLQPDINYRGFTASPLLGTPQGLSLYMDGVRLNQPFGDTVSWDLIPQSAIAGMQLMPGSNPLFGLNTLGGALSIQTKTGRDYPGAVLEGKIGTYGRKQGTFEYGGSKGNLDWFITGNWFDEDGWRDHSPSESKQIFGKVGWQDEKTDVHLTYSRARSDLNGNGLLPTSFMNRDYSSVYTYPDNTKNDSDFLNLQLSHAFNDKWAFAGNTYYRKYNTKTFNGDIDDSSLPEVPGQRGESTYNMTNGARCHVSGTGGFGSEPGEKCNGLINRTETDQTNYGLFGQLEFTDTIAGKPNKAILGAGADHSRSKFDQTAQFGVLTADRGITATPYFADGSDYGGGIINLNGETDDRRVQLRGTTTTWSIYGTDTLSLTDTLHATVSGRYNKTEIKNSDQLTPSGDGSLSGTHRYNRFNPAVGLAFTPSKAINAYVGYNEGNRAPTPIELGCADPENDCRLPNSMAGDPHLKQVVTKTWEGGLRGTVLGGLRWNVGLFNAENQDDILFVGNGATGQGYFKNFGETRRRGFEGGLGGEFGALSWGANYTFLDATFQTNDTLPGNNNSSASDYDVTAGPTVDINGKSIQVHSGDRIPLVPRHIFKAFASYRITPQFNIGADVYGVSSSYARGNENNQHQPGTVNYATAAGANRAGWTNGTYLGKGESAGYAILNLKSSFEVTSQWQVFAQVNNVLDRKYSTAATLGSSPFDPNTGAYSLRSASNGACTSGNCNSSTVGETFFAPGAPRTGWIGVRVEFDRPKKSGSSSADLN